MSSNAKELERGTDNRGRKRSPLSLHGFALLTLSFQTLGVIYSDIGTSPLYVLNGIWPASGSLPSEEDIIGGISAIVWALTLLPLIKYVFISLSFGTGEGEGGTFALFQGLYPPEDKDEDSGRTLTGDSFTRTASFGHRPEGKRISQSIRWPLLIWCLLGTSLTIADGIFTPAVSVTSAVAGIAVAKASISNDVTPISIAILVVLFLAQRFGTNRIASLFAPVAFIWLCLLAATGIYNITFHPGIFRAFDPSRAVLLFVRTGDYDLLSGVLLAVTGCEAVFANLGQFNALSIRLSFSLFVYPALVLQYLGQGARLIKDGEPILSNIFYESIPGKTNGPLYWILFVFAILATIIASQAMITATFSLVQQLVHMKSLPSIRMVHTSDQAEGQIYVPAVNWILMILTIIVVAAFKNSTNLTNAYGFAVATVMFSTSILLALQMKYVKQWHILIALAYVIVFGFFDGIFWGAALKKIPKGAWVPLLIGVIVMLFMLFWTWAKGLEDAFDGANRKNLRHFISVGESEMVDHVILHRPLSQIMEGKDSGSGSDPSEDEQESAIHDTKYYYTCANSDDRKELVRIPTCAIFHKVTGGRGVPHTFVGFIRQWPALPRVVIFLSVVVLHIARIDPQERYIVNKVRSIDGFYGVTYYVGFRDDFDVKIDEIVDRICDIEIRANPKEADIRIQEIKQVVSTTTHIVPHFDVSSKRVQAGKLSVIVNFIRKFLIEDIYRRLVTMFPGTANWLTSADEIIHVGISATI